MDIRDTQKAVHATALDKGWWKKNGNGLAAEPTTDEVLAKLALVHSEVSEMVEEARVSRVPELHTFRLGEGGKPEGFGIEAADVVIRLMDLCGALGIDLEMMIEVKHAFNGTRSHRHGGKLA